MAYMIIQQLFSNFIIYCSDVECVFCTGAECVCLVTPNPALIVMSPTHNPLITLCHRAAATDIHRKIDTPDYPS